MENYNEKEAKKYIDDVVEMDNLHPKNNTKRSKAIRDKGEIAERYLIKLGYLDEDGDVREGASRFPELWKYHEIIS